ncbi:MULTISPECIES: hypothetical protein [Caballeronia]|uniref:Lipoprotein n=1 Tax=Caballeronia jiangsuensis TaxID=1458357 RepID=A0ABW9CFD7_9BURK|nr:hypothetical protein [Caballeronia sp. GaOx3]
MLETNFLARAFLSLCLLLTACATGRPEVADTDATPVAPTIWWVIHDWNTGTEHSTSGANGTVTMVGKHNVDVLLEALAPSGAGDVQVGGQLQQVECGHIQYVSSPHSGTVARVISGERTYDAQLPSRDFLNSIPLVLIADTAYNFNPTNGSSVHLCPATVGQYQGTTVGGTIQLKGSATSFQDANVKSMGTLTINLVPCSGGRYCQ